MSEHLGDPREGTCPACSKELEAELVRLQKQLAEQDARGLRLAGEIDRLEAELAEATQEVVRVIFKERDLRVAKDARVIALETEVESLRDEIADLRGDGFPDPAEGVIAEDISP